MSGRRKFIVNGLMAGVSASLLSQDSRANSPAFGNKKKHKHWVWIRPSKQDKDEDLVKRYADFYSAGIKGVFFESDSERHFRIAKKAKLEAHRWMWTLNRGEQTLLQSHPEWYAINRKGESCSDKPPYVNYYRWLCPSREETATYLENDVKSILQKDYIDGIHLDYVRYCDVILPLNLWEQYKIEQTKELPEYDFCYCEVCRNKFKEWKGIDPLDLQYPEENLSWRQYRYDAVTKIVNRLSKVAASYRKPITAAVFPTPEVARRNVRQDWANWNLDGIFPMIYHGFYKEDVSWIGDAVKEGLKALDNRFPLYAGIYLPDFSNKEEILQGMESALNNGAAGISVFGNINDDVLELLKKTSSRKS